MAGGWRDAATLLLLLLLFSTPSATPKPSTSTSAPPPTTSRPPSSAPATSATSFTASYTKLSAMTLESGALSPQSASFTSSPAPSAVFAHVPGCDPTAVANRLYRHCVHPIPSPRCCRDVLSTVARPTCFCLVQKEGIYIISAVRNRSTMGNLLDRCGAFPGMRRIVDDPCGDTTNTSDDHGCATPVKASAPCVPYKIATIIGWSLLCVLLGAVLYARRRTRVPDVEAEDALREGCRCIRAKCATKTCGCNKRGVGCTNACQCRGCVNPHGIRSASAALEMVGS